MTLDQIKTEILKLPLEERFELVSDIWNNWDNYLPKQFITNLLYKRIEYLEEKFKEINKFH